MAVLALGAGVLASGTGGSGVTMGAAGAVAAGGALLVASQASVSPTRLATLTTIV